MRYVTRIVWQVGAVRGPWTWLVMFSVVLSGPAAIVGVAGAVDVRRFTQNPIARPQMLLGRDGGNINGPSLMRVPTWAPNRLGNYYLYFAHHNGKYIRLAYADRLEGPWRIYEPGALTLGEASGCTGHIASPDVHVDEARHEIRMYFHGPAKGGGGQKSFVAVSKDGLHFQASAETLGLFYFRAFPWQDAWYAMAKGGLLYRSKDGLTAFEQGPNPFPGSETRGPEYNQPGARHVALHRVGNLLWVYYSNIGDEPERILRCSMQLGDDWTQWKVSAPQEVLRPQTAYEGVDLPLRKSVAGAMRGRENALRDPAIFADVDGRVYLLYSVAGESGIGIAELKEDTAGDGQATGPVGPSIPSWFPTALPLPLPPGEMIRVATVDELLAAVDRVGAGGTILLADGHYQLPRVVVLQGKKGIAIRSAAGDPAKVVLSGKGWNSEARNDDILHVGHCEGVTIADLTFTDCRSYGIKVEAENAPQDIHIYNCRFRDIGVRAIKGSAGQDPNVRAVRGSVRYCQFENTKVPPADWLYGGDYIAAIDMMALDGWTFSDNVFRNIKGRNGGGRAAIFIWVRSRAVVVERNLIVDCDRGVAFGNPGQSTANNAGERLVYVAEGIIRNNFIAGGADCGIELWYADRIKVYHNTIWRSQRNWSRGIRVGTGTSHAEVVNNLVHGEIRLEGGQAQLRQNLTGRLDGYFVDPPSGNLALTAAAAGAIDQGISLPEVTDDIRGRPRRGRVDLGAWEGLGDPNAMAKP